MAEEPAREQGSQEQPPAWICSPLELIQADLTSTKHLDVLPQGHLLPGTQGIELSFLQQEIEGQPALSPPQSPDWELCSIILLRSILVTQVGGEHLDNISSWLGSSSQHLLTESLHKLLSHSTSPSLLLPTAGFTFPWGVPPCRPPELAVTLEFRPGQCPEVTHCYQSSSQHAAKSHTQGKDTGRNAELPSSSARSKVTGCSLLQGYGAVLVKRWGYR